MREALALRLGLKSVYRGTFERYGWRKFMGQYVGKTVLLVHIKDKEGREVTDHIWLKQGKRLAKVPLKKGDEISFEARVGTYKKGYDYDYHLEYADNIKKLEPDTFHETGQRTLD